MAFTNTAQGHLKALGDMYTDINGFLSAYTAWILQFMDNGVIFTFKTCYLRKTFCKEVYGYYT